MNTIVNGTTLFATYGLSSVFTAENYKKSGMALGVAMTNDQTTEFLGQILKGSKLPSPANMVHVQLNPDRATPLHVAVMLGRADYVEFLLANGANPELADSHGWLPYHHCALLVDKTIAQIFDKLGLGSKATTSGYTYATIRHAAGIERNPAMVQQKIYYNGQEVDYNHPPVDLLVNLRDQSGTGPKSFTDVPYYPPSQYGVLWRNVSEPNIYNYGPNISQFLLSPRPLKILAAPELGGSQFKVKPREGQFNQGDIVGLYSGTVYEKKPAAERYPARRVQGPTIDDGLGGTGANVKVDPRGEKTGVLYNVNEGYPNSYVFENQLLGIPSGQLLMVAKDGVEDVRFWYGGNYYELMLEVPCKLLGKEEMEADFRSDRSPIVRLERPRDDNDRRLALEQILYVLTRPAALLFLHVSGVVNAQVWLDMVEHNRIVNGQINQIIEGSAFSYVVALCFALIELDKKLGNHRAAAQVRLNLTQNVELVSMRDMIILLNGLLGFSDLVFWDLAVNMDLSLIRSLGEFVSWRQFFEGIALGIKSIVATGQTAYNPQTPVGAYLVRVMQIS